MKLDTIFGFLVPKDHKFFPLFNKAADNLVLSSELLVKLVKEKNPDECMEIIGRIRDVEHIGDDITRRLLFELNVTFITPFDREDIHELINKMDDIVDYIHAASKRIGLYKVNLIPEEFIWIADRIHSANKEIQIVLHNVRSVNDFENYANNCEKIREYESQVDDIYQEYLSNLFELEVNAIELIKKRDILTTLEKAIDKCDDVANIFSSIIVKMG